MTVSFGSPRIPLSPYDPANQFAVVSLFSGAGGFDLGVEQSGLARLVWALDNDPSATASYRRNLGNHVWTGDARTTIPPNVACDILIGGPPCQDFSSLWKRGGLKTARGSLFVTMAEFLETRRPKAFIFENVEGVMSANNRDAYTRIRHALKAPTAFLERDTKDAVRYELSVEVVNFADLGVPQRRKRLIITGIRRDLRLYPRPIPKPFRDAPVTAGQALNDPPIQTDAANHRLTTESRDIVERLKMIAPGENYSAVPEDHPLHVKGMMSNIYRRLDPDEPAFTVTASGGGGSFGYHPTEHRRLTNRERARLQGYPDDFVFEDSDGRSDTPAIRRQIGNSVPPIAGKALIENLCRTLLAGGVRGVGREQIELARSYAESVNPGSPTLSPMLL